ncbi:nuclear transport factor 2 family protein [soil metagenome]
MGEVGKIDMTDEDPSILEQNEAFYAAFNARDATAMAALWSEEAPCACLHPSSPPIHGREAVLRSWSQILGSPNAPLVACERTEIRRYGTTAIVACFERVGERRSDKRTIAVLAATNVFVLERGRWRLVHHHSSPIGTAMRETAPDPRVLN